MELDHKELMFCCVSVLDTFDPDAIAVEAHANNFLKYQPHIDGSEQTFIVEVFSGCVRYSKVLQVLMKGFYNRDGKTILRSEDNLYKVIAYLALFRLDELGMGHFRKFVRSQDTNKMYKFLNYAFSDKNLRTWMKDEWSKLYETSFVQTTLLSPILRWLPEIEELVQQLKDKIDAKIPLVKPQYPITETKPFKLTQPRPRSIPVPEPIPKLKSSKPVPKSMYSNPKEYSVISEIKEKNRKKAEERLFQASQQQFACANPEKSNKTKQKIADLQQEEDDKLDFERHNANPVPHEIFKDNAPVKLNAATILREGQLYRKREAKELAKLEKLESGTHDASEFLEWQTKMREEDNNRRIAEIERKRLEGKLSHEDAIMAKQNLTLENKRKVEQMKQEAEQLMEKYFQQKMIDDEIVRNQYEKVISTHQNAKEAKKKLQEYKAKIVQEVAQEGKELMRQALEEAEKDMLKKMELIEQIRAMEATPVIRHNKLVDLTAKAGYGLLSEMSIAELRERLALLNIQNKEEEEEKRDEIMSSKEAKNQALLDTLETISRHRNENSKAAAVKLEVKKKTRHDKPAILYEDESLKELQRKLDERKAERLREQEKNKIKPNKKSADRLRELSKSKKMTEERRWQELELNREKTAKLSSKGISSSATASRIANRGMMISGYS